MEELAGYIFERILTIHSSESGNDEKLRLLRITAEEMLKKLIAGNGVRISGIIPMAVFLFDKNLDAKRFEDEFFGFIRLGNKASHTFPLDATNDEVDSCIKAFSTIVSTLTACPVPTEIELIYEGRELPPLRHKILQNKEIVEFISATIKRTIWRAKSGERLNYIDLICYAEELGNFTVRIYKSVRQPVEGQPSIKTLYDWGQFIPEYSRVNFFNILQDPENPQHFSLDYTKTLVVLEPDFLLEAKDVGSLFQRNERYPVYYVIEKLLPGEGNWKMFKGTLVNNFLDKYLFEDEVNFEAAFDEFITENLITTYSIKEYLGQIKEEIKTVHLPRIKASLPILKGNNGEYTVTTEPTFYSPMFGITGRLDILQSSVTDPKRKNVLELKSGKVPNFGVWKQEEMQVTAYNLLMQSNFGNDRRGDSSIFYSAAQNNPVRNVPVMTTKSIEFLTGRNEIFLMLYLLKQNDDRVFSRLLQFSANGLPEFILKNIARFKTVFEASSPLEQKYYRASVSFLINELFDSKISANDNEGGDSSFASLWRQQPLIKEESQFSLIRGLEFDNYDEQRDLYFFRRTKKVVAKFREKDLIILYPYTEELDPLHREILKGSIAELTNEIVAVKLFNKQVDRTVFNTSKYFAIEPDFKDGGILSNVKMMFGFLDAFSRNKELLLGLTAPKSEPLSTDKLPGLHPSQEENVLKALAAKDYFLLQGPPGTGKTSFALLTIVEKILKRSPDETVTILAFTNKAIKEVCNKLNSVGIKYLFNSSSEEDDNSLKTMVKTHDLESFGEYVKSIRVVTSTVASFVKYSNDLKSFFRFDTLIVDEASQLLEPQLAGIVVNFNRFILIGDQNQLPAVTVQSDVNTLISDPVLNEIGITDMKISLFERMFNTAVQNGWTNAYGTLIEQFRMDEKIMQMINHYYHDGLRCAFSVKQNLDDIYPTRDESKISELLISNRLIFIETPLSKTGKNNESEANIVAQIVEKIKINGLSEKNGSLNLGIITPWRAQIATIKQKLEEIGITGVPVDTVERFQGSENRVIIYSTSVSNHFQLERLGSIGINRSTEAEVEVDRKLNVVLSRAQEQIIILGSVSVLRTSQHYKKVLETILRGGRFVAASERVNIFGT